MKKQFNSFCNVWLQTNCNATPTKDKQTINNNNDNTSKTNVTFFLLAVRVFLNVR